MLNIALKYNGGCAYAKGIFVVAEGSEFSNWGLFESISCCLALSCTPEVLLWTS
jgi:hypothetical protein